MSELQTTLESDTWISCTWDEYIQMVKNPSYEKAKCYYHNGKLRIEMPPVGPDHANNNGIIMILVNLFALPKLYQWGYLSTVAIEEQVYKRVNRMLLTILGSGCS